LVALDPEMSEHFKVLADFEDEVDRSPASEDPAYRPSRAKASSR
jgi:hypothetical protein